MDNASSKKINFNSLIPEFSVTNLEKSIHFYVMILGFKVEYKRDECKFAFLSYGDSQLMIEEINEYWKTGKLEYPFGRGINFQFEIDNCEAVLEKIRNHDYPVFIAPEDNWYRVDNRIWGSREFLVLDPDGYLLRFSQDLGFKDPENESE